LLFFLIDSKKGKVFFEKPLNSITYASFLFLNAKAITIAITM